MCPNSNQKTLSLPRGAGALALRGSGSDLPGSGAEAQNLIAIFKPKVRGWAGMMYD